MENKKVNIKDLMKALVNLPHPKMHEKDSIKLEVFTPLTSKDYFFGEKISDQKQRIIILEKSHCGNHWLINVE